MYFLALSDGGKTKVAIRFDENDGILKYYKEFGSITCTFQGPPSTPYKVRLLDNTRREICAGGLVLQISNAENLCTDETGSSSFSCIISKGCQAYESMFFILSISWTANSKVNSILSCPFVSGSKGPAEPASDKNRYRPVFQSKTSYNAFKANNVFISLNITQNALTHVTQYVKEDKQINTYYVENYEGLINEPPVAYYYKAKTRSQSHRVEVQDQKEENMEGKIKEKLSTQAGLFAQQIVRAFLRSHITQAECDHYEMLIPSYFAEVFNEEFKTQWKNNQAAIDLMSPGKLRKEKQSRAGSTSRNAINTSIIQNTPLAKPGPHNVSTIIINKNELVKAAADQRYSLRHDKSATAGAANTSGGSSGNVGVFQSRAPKFVAAGGNIMRDSSSSGNSSKEETQESTPPDAIAAEDTMMAFNEADEDFFGMDFGNKKRSRVSWEKAQEPLVAKIAASTSQDTLINNNNTSAATILSSNSSTGNVDMGAVSTLIACYDQQEDNSTDFKKITLENTTNNSTNSVNSVPFSGNGGSVNGGSTSSGGSDLHDLATLACLPWSGMFSRIGSINSQNNHYDDDTLTATSTIQSIGAAAVSAAKVKKEQLNYGTAGRDNTARDSNDDWHISAADRKKLMDRMEQLERRSSGVSMFGDDDKLMEDDELLINDFDSQDPLISSVLSTLQRTASIQRANRLKGFGFGSAPATEHTSAAVPVAAQNSGHVTFAAGTSTSTSSATAAGSAITRTGTEVLLQETLGEDWMNVSSQDR